MFTGLVEDTGSVASLSPTSSGSRLVVHTSLDLAGTQLGDSIAVDGVCLTVVAFRPGARTEVAFDVGPETLAVSSFRSVLRPGRTVHLERALRVGDRLGGHIVAGHVDGVGTVRRREPQGDALFIGISAPPPVVDLCIPKGSIAIDGVSLTVNTVDDDGFDVCLIPHTLGKTHLPALRIGDVVNLESDVIGKYVQRLVSRGRSGGAAVDMSLLERAGFLR